MKNVLAGIAALALMAWPACADDVQFAQPDTGASSPANQPRLSDIMSSIQSRHVKLWYSGHLGNWPLVNYELAQIRDAFMDAAWLYRNIPVDAILLVTKPIDEMNAAIKAKNKTGFEAAFGKLTTGCNACHAAADVGFILIKPPTASPFSNQSFEPTGK